MSTYYKLIAAALLLSLSNNSTAMLAIPRAALLRAAQSSNRFGQVRTVTCCDNSRDIGEKRMNPFDRVTATLVQGFGIKDVAELDHHAKRFEQELHTAYENNCSNKHCDVHID